MTTTERLAADISRDLRLTAHGVTEDLLIEAADKLDGLIAALAAAETARDVSRTIADKLVAKMDGGEWTTAYGDSDPSQPDRTRAIEWCEMPGCANEDCEHDRQRIVWLGPVTAVAERPTVTPAPTPPARPGDTRTPTNDGGTQ